MLSPPLTRIQAAADLGFALAVFLLCSAAEPQLDPILRRGHGPLGVLALAAYQFACEGCAPVAVLLWRRERPSAYGFRGPRFVRSATLALVLAGINDVVVSVNAHERRWIPFGRHSAAGMALSSAVPGAILGIVATVAIWGFMEAFFGVFFARRVNTIARHDGRGWLSPGALAFATFNGAIHYAIGQGPSGFATSFASGYAIGTIPAVADNAWGSALFQALTNAVGHA